MADLRLLEEAISKLAHAFVTEPHQFFSERELQSEFYGLCRGRFGSERPKDRQDVDVHLFRHEYNTIGRYKRSEAFRQRHADQGTTGVLDFAILKPDFVAANDLLVVINKHERRRTMLREATVSPVLDVGMEFKMAHVREKGQVSRGAVNVLAIGIEEDCCKLARERPAHAYVVAFSHGPDPTATRAAKILSDGHIQLKQFDVEGLTDSYCYPSSFSETIASMSDQGHQLVSCGSARLTVIVCVAPREARCGDWTTGVVEPGVRDLAVPRMGDANRRPIGCARVEAA
jgi:hypothetical protein